MKRSLKLCSALTLGIISSSILSSCATPEPQAPTAITQTLSMHGDYPAYNLDALTAEAAQVVRATVVRTSETTIYPTFEGDDPLVNPMVGKSEEEIAQAREDAALPGTDVVIQVTEVHKGTASVGSELTVLQTGGLFEGVVYVDEEAPILSEGVDYLLFLSGDEKPYILGGGAGSYEAVDNEFVATSDLAPVDDFTINNDNEIVADTETVPIE